MNMSICRFFTSMLMLSPGALCSAPGGPVDVEWQLSVLGAAPVAALPGGRPANLVLDSEHNRATGFAGCNRFSGSYELSGTSLRFGPLAATRMACPDEESALETGFLDALGRTRGWRLDADMLLLLDGSNVLARLEVESEGAAAPDLESLVFYSSVLTSGPVKLAEGGYRAPAAPGSASMVEVRLTDNRAFGVLNGARAGVVIAATSLGGSATFRELALLSKTAEGWVNRDTVLLGDRIRVKSVAIDGGAIVISMTEHAPQDPQCCPTQDVQKRFIVRDNRLEAVAEAAPAMQP